jgi:histidinol-phosphate aminotransferase
MSTRRNLSLVAASEQAHSSVTLDANKYFDEWLQTLMRESAMARTSSRAAQRPRQTVELIKPQTLDQQLDPEQLVRLTFNENPLGPSPLGLAAARSAMTQLHRYPDDGATSLKNALVRRHSCGADEIVTGNGSTELIALLTQTFCESDSDDEVLAATPSYPLYQLEAEKRGVKFVAVPLRDDFSFDVGALLAAATERTRLCFISNPNNPTGGYLSRAEFERLARELPEHVILVMDEAYLEFATAVDFPDSLACRDLRRRMVTLRTFSKAYGLAGLRAGYMVAPPDLASEVQQTRQQFSVNALAQVAALAALRDEEHIERTRQVTAEGMAYLTRELDRLGVHCLPSQANFLLLDLGRDARPIYEALQERGVLVRLVESPHHMRVTIGHSRENERFVQSLEEVLAARNIGSRPPHPLFSQLLAAGAAINRGDEAEAGALLESVESQASFTGEAHERVACAFARGLRARLTGDVSGGGNLYLKNINSQDMLSAFQVLVHSTPLVAFGHLSADFAIAAAVERESAVHLIDIGIGGGSQWPALLRMLAERPGGPPRVRLTGIDLPATTEDPERRLREAGALLREQAAEVGVPFEYRAIVTHIEHLDLRRLDLRPGETVAINSAFTLHHLPTGAGATEDLREAVISRIRALDPRIVTLIEPDAEHNALPFLPRLREALGHYTTVFDALDAVLPRTLTERYIIEQEFFGREALNVVAGEGPERVERHERRQRWERRMRRNGFSPIPPAAYASQVRDVLALKEGFSILAEAAALTLAWRAVPLVAASAWRIA